MDRSTDSVLKFYRCGALNRQGCGKILPEPILLAKGCCPYCGSIYFSGYNPRTRWQRIKCYLIALRHGVPIYARNDSRKDQTAQAR